MVLQNLNPSLSRSFAASLAAAVVAAAPSALAQNYPAKPIRIIAAQTAGGGTDLFARMLGQKISENWKQPVVVENRPGAGGAIGNEITAKSAPDGYTLILATAGQMVINQSLYPDSGHDPLKELAPIALFATSPLVLVMHPSVPAHSVRELIALAKAAPNRLNHGSGGGGSPAHLAAELFKALTGTQMTHVPFKGVAPSVTAVIAGQIDLTFASVAAVLPHVKAQRLRALAVTTPRRSQIVPDLPTIAEAGVPGYEVTTWYGLFGPAALPKDLISKLNVEVIRVLALPDVRARLYNEGAESSKLSVEEFGAFVRTDAARWAKVIKSAGIKAERE
jgi:tripartite-type tricarboxylate transporter receptor subunit TctC